MKSNGFNSYVGQCLHVSHCTGFIDQPGPSVYWEKQKKLVSVTCGNRAMEIPSLRRHKAKSSGPPALQLRESQLRLKGWVRTDHWPE